MQNFLYMDTLFHSLKSDRVNFICRLYNVSFLTKIPVAAS